MFKELHNKLGEKGQALTVLSLLEGPDYVAAGETVSGSLRDVSERLRQMTGGNDTELVSMYSVYPSEGGSLEFLALELVPLRQAIQRINEINGRGGNGDVRTVLSVLDRQDELDDSDGAGPSAIGRLRDTLRSLFNRAGENGQSLTVLSLLSEPDAEDTPGG
jgi:hypothetical protein